MSKYLNKKKNREIETDKVIQKKLIKLESIIN